MQYIGEINIEYFKKISYNIYTNKVILTDKQKEHIMRRHPEIFQKYGNCFRDIVENPDYILRDKTRNNTALLLKTIKEKDSKKGTVNMVLRLAVEGDDINNKNSIITCIPIGDNRLKTYKKNGDIIWKKLDKNE